MEKWKDVINHVGRYMVSNFGRIKSKNRILLGTIDADGYRVFTFYFGDGSYKKMHTQRIVCMHFVDNPYNKPTVNHKDGNKLNNHIDNLEWATWAEQNRHAIDTGLRKSKSGIIFTAEHRANISKSKLGKSPWNKGKKGVQIPWNKGLKCSTL